MGKPQCHARCQRNLQEKEAYVASMKAEIPTKRQLWICLYEMLCNRLNEISSHLSRYDNRFREQRTIHENLRFHCNHMRSEVTHLRNLLKVQNVQELTSPTIQRISTIC
ncbi:10022_t:CDS:1 [Funneliformis mosseae]|uniref:10022_t:CDS:1 n=1 Tax=Funneliformis mosseae TaxID=27381 RepID=A0A9N9BW66_FUNMO|nr:10022_t:CDS:1 [Funneliformis mosseae]